MYPMKLAALLLVFCLSLPVYGAPICSVHDGDTFRFCTGLRVRMACIDTPELGQQFSHEARDSLKAMVQSEQLALNCQGKSYQRRVCFVRSNGQDVGLSLVASGLAYADIKYPYCLEEYKQALLKAEAEAKANRRGVWNLPGGDLRPWEYRHTKYRRK